MTVGGNTGALGGTMRRNDRRNTNGRRNTKATARARKALAVAAATLGAGGLLLVTAGPAMADGSSPSGGTATGDSGTPSAPGAAQLGGYNLTSSAAGVRVTYEQPNFPFPATPTFEFSLGYSGTSFDSGPIAAANASALWPGQAVAGGGSQLALLLNPYLQEYSPQLQAPVDSLLPTQLTYPVQAVSAFPQGPATASNDNGPIAMNSSASQTAAEASSAVGQVGGPASQSALPAGMLSVQAVGSTSQDTLDSLGNAVAEATSTVHGVSLAGGLVTIGAVTSTATSSSDGNKATESGTSTVTGVTIAGEPVAIDSSGIHVLTQSQNLLGMLVPSVSQVLSTAGITLSLTSPTDTVNGAAGQRELDGLSITINLATYDQDFTKLVAMLPSQLQSSLLDQIPLPTPYKQSITIDLGWTNVNAAASPAYNVDLLGGGDNSGDNGGLSGLGASTSPLSSGDLGLGSSPTPLASGSTPSSSPAGGAPSNFAATQPVALFKGVGSGLILLGLLLAALLVWLLMRADSAVGAMAAAPVCNDETP